MIPSNEKVIDIIDDCWVNSSVASMVRGVLLLTSHRLVYIEYDTSDAHKGRHAPTCLDRLSMSSSVFFIPIASTADVILRRFIQKHYHGLEVVCKDGISLMFRFRREAHNEMTLLEKLRRFKIETLWRREEDSFSLFHAKFVGEEVDAITISAPGEGSPGALLTARSEEEMFVYVTSDGRDLKDTSYHHHSRRSSASEDFAAVASGLADVSADESTWSRDVVALRDEYNRLLCLHHDSSNGLSSSTTGIINNIWRVCDVNKYFAICPTYPPLLVVPASLSDELIIKASRERSAFRLPALTWVHPTNGASLTRSSQPIVGINVTACPSDEQLLMKIRESAVLYREKQQMQTIGAVSLDRETDRTPVGANGGLGSPEITDSPASIFPTSESALDEESGEDSCSPTVGFIGDRHSEGNRVLHCGTSRSISAEDPSISAAIAARSISVDDVAAGIRGNSPMSSVSANSAIGNKGESNVVGGDAALTKIGGLMQGFRGTQSIVLRDGQYHKAKSMLHKKIDAKGLLTFQRRTKLRVVDCRPLLNAKGNVLMGKGHEVIDRLGGSRCTSVEFANIANIHGNFYIIIDFCISLK